MSIDLHCHSGESDGTYDPRALVRMAKANGCSMLALTDHDSVSGLAAAKAEADRLGGLRFVNGVEISVQWEGSVFHVLAYDFDPDNADFAAGLAKNRAGRIDRMRRSAQKMEKHAGVKGVFEGAMALSRRPEGVGRAHAAEYLYRSGAAPTRQAVFEMWLGEGKPCYEGLPAIGLEECLEITRAAGGVASVAHPLRYSCPAEKVWRFVERFARQGGQAIEASGARTAEELDVCLGAARRYGLRASVGSDYHGPHRSSCVLGLPRQLPQGASPVWELFADPH